MADIISAVGTLPAGDPISRRSWAKSLHQMDRNVLTHILTNRAFEHFRPDEILPKISCPVLLLQGNPALEGILEDPDVERMLTHVAHCTHVRFPDLGHDIHGMQPIAFFQIVSNFLESF